MADPGKDFAQQLNRNIDVWLKRTEGLAEGKTKGLYKKFPNLLRLIKQSLASPQTRTQKLAILVQQSFWIPNEYGRWPIWEPLIKNCLSLFDDKRNKTYIQLLIQQGKCFNRMRKINKAIEYHQKALKLAKELNNSTLMIELLYNLCSSHKILKEYEQAIQFGEESLQLAQNLDEIDVQVSMILNEIGTIYLELGENKNSQIAEQKFRAALDYSKNEPFSALHYKININLGIALHSQNLFNEALAIYNRVKKQFEDHAYELDKSRLWNSYGVTYFYMQKYQEAEFAFLQANNNILKESGDVFLKGTINQNIGNTLTKQNRFLEAESFLWRAINLWEQINERFLLANSFGILGESKALAKQFEESEMIYSKAIQILLELPKNPATLKLLDNLIDEKRSLQYQH